MKYEDGKPILMSGMDNGRAKHQTEARSHNDCRTDCGIQKAGVLKLVEYDDGSVGMFLSKGLGDASFAHLEIGGAAIGPEHYRFTMYDDRYKVLEMAVDDDVRSIVYDLMDAEIYTKSAMDSIKIVYQALA